MKKQIYIYIGLFLCLAFLTAAMVTAEINNSTNSSNNNSTNEFNDSGNLTTNLNNFSNPMNINLPIITIYSVNPSNNTGIQEVIDALPETGGIRTIELEDGIYNQSNAEIKVNKSNVTIKNADDANPIITTYGNGRAFNVNESNTTFIGLTITNTNANDPEFVDRVGGGISFANSNNSVVIGCNLINNTAPNSGGGIYFNNGNNNNISDCNLTNNTATNGGGIYSNNGNNNDISDCNLTNNTATNGGGIYSNNGNNNDISDCNLTNNTATSSGGGGIFIESNSNNNISDCTLTNNTAANAGGGIHVYRNNNNNSIIGCTLTNNTVAIQSHGGGIYFDNGNNNNNSIIGCTLTNNTAAGGYGGGDGGGISFYGGNNNSVIGCTLTNNTAANAGGGICFFSTSNNNVNACNLINNTAANGGGISFYESNNNNVNACNLINNTAATGGGISFYSISNNNVSACNLTNNTATTTGGGIFIYGSNNNISACNLINNTATTGGGIDFPNGAGTGNNVIYNRFYNNNAVYGMDIYILEDDNNISCNWWGNNNPTKGTTGQINAPVTIVYINHFVVRLSENDTNKTTNSNNTTVNIPASYNNVTLKYELVLNDTNSSDDTYKLPYFSALHTVNITDKPATSNAFSLLGSLEKFWNDLFRLVNADEPSDARTINETNSPLPYDNEILSFRNIVDNEYLVLNITSSDNYPPTPTNLTLSLSSESITSGESVTLTANLTDDSGEPIPNANIIFNINGVNYNNTNTNDNGIATIVFTPDHVGNYNIIAIYNGNDSYNASNSTSKILTVKSPTPPGPGPGHNDNNGGLPGFGNGLVNTGFPLIILLVLSVIGVFYWRRK